jgi:hypothetical protein
MLTARSYVNLFVLLYTCNLSLFCTQRNTLGREGQVGMVECDDFEWAVP